MSASRASWQMDDRPMDPLAGPHSRRLTTAAPPDEAPEARSADDAAGGPFASSPRLRILGVDIDHPSFADAIALLRGAAKERQRRVVYFANAHTLDLARRFADYRHILNDADLVLCDGTGVRWAARLQGVRLRDNLNGTDLIPAFLAATDRDGLRCYLLGDTPDVVARAAESIRRRFPGWTVAGIHHGFLDAAAEARVMDEIDQARPDLLLVGMGNPIQERWIAANRDRLAAHLVIGVGALFAYLAGERRRAPIAMRRGGLEWFAVLFTQRWKWRRYVIGAPRFLVFVVAARLFGEPRS